MRLRLHAHLDATRLKASKSRDIATTLRREIVRALVAGQLQDNDPLPSEHELLRRFGVARPTLREAMRTLEADGLIDVRVGGGGGAYVRSPGGATAARHVEVRLQLLGANFVDIYRVRTALGVEAIRALATAGDEDAVARLRSVIETARTAIESPMAFTEACYLYEEELIRLSGNAALVALMEAVHGVIAAQGAWVAERVTFSPAETADRCIIAVHALERAADLIAAGDPDRAGQFWREHHEAMLLILADYWGDAKVIDAVG